MKSLRLLLPILFLLALPGSGCKAPVTEADPFQMDLPDGVIKIGLPDCPPAVKKIIHKELKEYFTGDKYSGETQIYQADTDQNGIEETICFFRGPDGIIQFLMMEGAGLVSKDFWYELNKSEMKIVSLVKKGECEILFKRSGGGGNFESSFLTLHKKQGGAFKEIFTGDFFRHEWKIGEKEKFTGTYYAFVGDELPLQIRQFPGELAQDYDHLPKFLPNFEIKQRGPKPQKIYVWDAAQFKFAEKK
jgi:hypothetical protein